LVSRHLGADLDLHVENSSADDEKDEAITRCASTDSIARSNAAPETGKHSSTLINSETPNIPPIFYNAISIFRSVATKEEE
jgi:hypothetical protein